MTSRQQRDWSHPRRGSSPARQGTARSWGPRRRLNLQEGWWRLFRREAFAGQSFATPEEITLATWSRPASWMPVPARGCGAAHHHRRATDATPLPTGS